MMRSAPLVVIVMACCSGSLGDPPPPVRAQEDTITGTDVVTSAAPPGTSIDLGAGQHHAVTASAPPGIECLRIGYGEYIEAVENVSSRWFVVLKNGARLLFDDGEEKSFTERLGRPDLQDQVSISYPSGRDYTVPKENDDPGRIRQEALLKAVYGETRESVEANLVDVAWLPKRLGKTLRFNRKNGAAQALSKVSETLDERLPKSAIRYISQPAGTFNWRRIAGTDRLSAHSFGIAVDINVDVSNYWRWETNGKSLVYKNRVPLDIVEVFEANGFIWGGKWYHFDTMHFEYRPELLAPPCLR